MVFLLEDAPTLQGSSVTFLSEQLADCLKADLKRLQTSLPKLIEQGIDEEKRPTVRRKWASKDESIRFTTTISTSPTVQKELHINLSPVYTGKNQLHWMGECSKSLPTSSTGGNEDVELSNVSYKQLFDSLPNAAILLDFKANQIIRANEGFERLFGYTSDEAKGADIDELIVPDDENPITQKELYQKGQHSVFTMQARRTTKTGESKEVLLTAAPVVYDGEVQSMFIIYLNVTETQKLLKQIKEQKDFAEAIIEGLPDIFYMFDEGDGPVLWNEHLKDVTGYSDMNLNDLSPLDLIIEEDRQRAKYAIRETLENGNYNGELNLLAKDGKIIPYYMSARRFERYEQKNIILFGTDISDLKKTEHQLRKANKEKETILEEIHHRIKNNLAHISGILELQSYSTDSEEVQSVLQNSQSRIQSIALLHDQLYQHESFKEVRLDKYIDVLTESIEHMWASDNKQISYHNEVDPVMLSVKDAVTCGMLINELVTNATKHAFTDRKKGNIWVSMEQINDKLQLQIADDGVGLPNNFSLDAYDSLGGTLINSFVQQLDADFSYESEKGTTFTIIFDHPELKDE